MPTTPVSVRRPRGIQCVFPELRHFFVAACCVLMAASPAWAGQRETERVNRTVSFAPGGTVELKNFSGKVEIVGTDRSEVSIHAVRRATRSRLDHVKLDIQVSDLKIEIVANTKVRRSWWDRFSSNNIVETDFEIEVPRETDLDIKVFSSPVRIDGVTGDHDVSGFSSKIDLRDVSGSIRATAFSGDIDIAMSRSAESPRLDLDTFSGNIKVRLTESASGNVEFRSFSGDLSSDYPLILRSKSRRRLLAALNPPDGRDRSANDLKFKTFSGDVLIRR